MFARVKFSAFSGLFEDFLNFRASEGVRIWDIRPADGGFVRVCRAEDYAKVARRAKKFGCKVRIKEKKGLCFSAEKLLKRKGIAAALAIFFILNLLFQNIVWRVDINAVDEEMKNRTANFLYSSGICAGAVYDKEKFEEAGREIAIGVEDAAFASLNFYRGVLECEIYRETEKEKYTRDTREGDITSLTDGVITDYRVYDGFGISGIGQSVSRGQVLVSCTYTDKFGNFFYSPTRAYIAGNAEKEYRVFVPYEKKADIYTGEETGEVRLNFLGKETVLKKADLSGWKNFSRRREISYVRPFGFCLPFTLRTDRYYRIEEKKMSCDLISAKNLALTRVNKLISEDEKLKEEKSRSYDYDVSDDGVEVSCRIRGLYEFI